MRLLRQTAALSALLLALGLVACGGTTPTPGDATETESAATDAPEETERAENGAPDEPATGGGDATASAEVTLTGGDDPGTYSGSVSDAGCSRGFPDEVSFGVQYSTDEDVDLTSVQVIVHDGEAAASGTDDFLLQVTIGPLFTDDGTTYSVEPVGGNDGEGDGTGTLTLEDQGGTATLRIEAQTADGVAIDATVTCHTVFDFGT